MKSLRAYLEDEFTAATPLGTMGMGNPQCPAGCEPGEEGSGDILNYKKKKRKKIKEGLLDIQGDDDIVNSINDELESTIGTVFDNIMKGVSQQISVEDECEALKELIESMWESYDGAPLQDIRNKTKVSFIYIPAGRSDVEKIYIIIPSSNPNMPYCVRIHRDKRWIVDDYCIRYNRTLRHPIKTWARTWKIGTVDKDVLFNFTPYVKSSIRA